MHVFQSFFLLPEFRGVKRSDTVKYESLSESSRTNSVSVTQVLHDSGWILSHFGPILNYFGHLLSHFGQFLVTLLIFHFYFRQMLKHLVDSEENFVILDRFWVILDNFKLFLMIFHFRFGQTLLFWTNSDWVWTDVGSFWTIFESSET